MEAEAGGGGLFVKDQSGEVPEVVFPVCGIVGVAVEVPDVRELLLSQAALSSLADAEQIIAAAAGEPDQMERIVGEFTGGDELIGGASIGGGGECCEPGEFVGVGEGEVQ